MKKMQTFLKSYKKPLFLLSASVLVLVGASVVYAQYPQTYISPAVILDAPTLSADHNTLNFVARGGSQGAGFLQENCGENIPGPSYVGGPRVYLPYVMQGGSFTASSVSGSISSGEIIMTDAGRAGVVCNDPSRSNGSIIDSGVAGSYSVSKSANVSSLSNGTYTLSVILCATSGKCTTDTEPFTINRPAPALNGSCIGTPSQPRPGQTVTWTASASGGTGSYAYSWSGAASGTGETVTASYSTEGTKTANVTISSGGQNITRSCSVTVQPPPDETCDIVVKSNVSTSWMIGGDGFTSYLTGSGLDATYPPNAETHPQRYNDSFGITFSDLANYTKVHVTPANQTCGSNNDPVTFEVRYDTVPPEEGDPICSGPTSGAPGQGLTFGATEGSGTGYTWSGGQNPSPTGNGTSFTTSFSTTGAKTITLTDSAGGTDTCPVTISSGLSCSASPSGVNPGGSTTITAGGGTGTGYTWTTGGSPASPSGNPVNVTYSTAGTKTVTVRDSSGAQAQCYVSVYSSTTYVCSPTTQTVEVGQASNFGTSPWGAYGNWYTAEGNPQRLSGYYLFSTTFSTPGTKTVYYTRTGSGTSECLVEVVEPQVNNASCVALSYPTQVVTGQQFQASATMQNTGTINWTNDASPHRLGSKNPNGNNVWGRTRVNLPFSPVNAGQQVTFNFTATAPSTAGTYSFDWGMLEEMVQWFGQSCVASPQINVTAGGTVNVTSNIATTWRLTGPDGIVNQTAPAISQSYTSKPAGSHSISNIPTFAGYNTPTVTPASSQMLGAGGIVTFTINYSCTDQDGDQKCDSVSGCVGGNCGGGSGGSGPDNCPNDYNPDQADSDGDGIGDACDDGEPPLGPDGGADFALSSTNNIRVDKNAGETQSNSTTIKVTPYNGFDGDVELIMLGILGPAVEGVFGDIVLSDDEYSTPGSSFHVVIPSDFPRGNYPIQIRGRSGGVDRTTTVILSVDESGPIFEEF